MLQEKLAEAHGLAIAAGAVTAKVEERVLDRVLRAELARMGAEAEETRRRCLAVYDGAVADELLAHANTTHAKAADLAAAWFKAGTDALRAWSFLVMAEAGEVAAWTTLAGLAVGGGEVAELCTWALPIQERHLDTAFSGIATLVEHTDPAGPRFG